jgi:hypothetical protein
MTTDSAEHATDGNGLAPVGVARDTGARAEAQRAFNLSIIVSGIRCTLAYVVLPFVTPFIGLAPGVGPALGIAIAVVAIAANLVSMRRFWRARHPWRRPITALHVAVIAFMVVLIVLDTRALAA